VFPQPRFCLSLAFVGLRGVEEAGGVIRLSEGYAVQIANTAKGMDPIRGDVGIRDFEWVVGKLFYVAYSSLRWRLAIS
jgi:hypothetical protein